MRCVGTLLALWLVPLAVLTGCAGKRCCEETGGSLFGHEAMALSDSVAQTTSSRGKVVADTSAVPSPDEVDAILAPPPEPPSYYLLTAHQCQCLALANAALANAVDEESEMSAAVSGRGRSSKQKSAALKSDLLGYQAVGQRNKAAAEALEVFYHLAEAEAHCDLLDASLAEIGQAIQDFDQMQDKGFKTESDGAALRQQQIALRDKKSQALLAIEQLNGKLRSMLGCRANDRTRIWPQADLTVAVAKVDVEGAIRQGLASRADLNGLRLMLRGVDSSDLSSVRMALAQIDPSLGSSPSRFPGMAQALGTSKQHVEAATRRGQIQGLLDRQEQAAEEEIRRAADTVEARLREIALAKQNRDHCHQRLERLQARRGSDGVTALDVTRAQLDLYQAESELVGKVVAWKIAEVKLLEAQGALPIECGYPLPQGNYAATPGE